MEHQHILCQCRQIFFDVIYQEGISQYKVRNILAFKFTPPPHKFLKISPPLACFDFVLHTNIFDRRLIQLDGITYVYQLPQACTLQNEIKASCVRDELKEPGQVFVDIKEVESFLFPVQEIHTVKDSKLALHLNQKVII